MSIFGVRPQLLKQRGVTLKRTAERPPDVPPGGQEGVQLPPLPGLVSGFIHAQPAGARSQ